MSKQVTTEFYFYFDQKHQDMESQGKIFNASSWHPRRADKLSAAAR